MVRNLPCGRKCSSVKVKMLNRENIGKYISEKYGIDAEYPWMQYPTNAVYRHTSNKKWFAVVMTLPKLKLGLKTEERVDVVNFKCDPIMVGSLHNDEGIFPGYHMNKNYWITVLLDGTVDDEKIKMLLDISFELTDKKR